MMTITVICAGGAGVLLGMTLRIVAATAASLVAVIAGVVLTAFAEWALLASVLYCAGLPVALQIGYLIGGALACARIR